MNNIPLSYYNIKLYSEDKTKKNNVHNPLYLPLS